MSCNSRIELISRRNTFSGGSEGSAPVPLVYQGPTLTCTDQPAVVQPSGLVSRICPQRLRDELEFWYILIS